MPAPNEQCYNTEYIVHIRLSMVVAQVKSPVEALYVCVYTGFKQNRQRQWMAVSWLGIESAYSQETYGRNARDNVRAIPLQLLHDGVT